MDISNKLGMFFTALNAAGVVYVIEDGYGFCGVMSVSLAITCLRAAAAAAVSWTLFPALALRPFFVSWKMFMELFHFGLKMQVTKISGMISAHLDKLLIIYFLSAGLVTYYQIGNMVVVYAVSVFVLLSSALMPAFSEIYSLGDAQKAVEGYQVGTRYVSLMAFPVFIFLVMCAPRLIYVWMGEGYDKAVFALRVLAVGWMFNTILGSIGSAFVQALNRPEVQMRGAVLNIVLNPVLSVLLLFKFGFYGVMCGTSLSTALAGLYFTWDLHREFKLPLGRFLLSALLLPFFASLLLAAAVWLIFPAAVYAPGFKGKIYMAFAVGLQFIMFFSMYGGLMYYLKPLRRIDADRIFGRWPLLCRFAANFCPV